MTDKYILVNASGTGSGSGAETYTQSFNSTSDWGAASGGFYTIAIPQSTHGKSLNPVVQLYEVDGTDFSQVDAEIVISPAGDVNIRVTEVIDTRFAGKVVII
jgi:hypothetical protein